MQNRIDVSLETNVSRRVEYVVAFVETPQRGRASKWSIPGVSLCLEWYFVFPAFSFVHEKDVQELAKGGSMDESSTSRKSKGFFGDMSDILGALSGGAHIVKREDGTV